MSALSELLSRANREQLSMQTITDRMRASGHQIGKDTVWKYMSGRHTVVRTEVLRAFADVFPSLRLAALEKAAGVPPELGQWDPPGEAATLGRRERDALDVIIKAMARGQVDEAGGQLVPFPSPDDFDVEAANRSPEPAGHQDDEPR